MTDLKAIESWMLSVITHPLGVRAGADGLEARSHLRITSDQLDRVIGTTPSWSAVDRLGIYWNAYYARLQDCLRDEYPVLRGMVGDELFDEFVLDYLQSHPPSSYTLSLLGAHFPGFLATTRPPRHDVADEPDWADFIAELAEFEWIISEVFDGPGIEGMALQPLNRLDCADDSLNDVTFDCAPCLRLCAFQFPVHSYHATAKAGATPKIPLPQPSCVAVTRQNFTVKHYSLMATEFALLNRLQAGHSLGNALDIICGDDEEADAVVAANIARWFADWTRAGFILRLIVPDS